MKPAFHRRAFWSFAGLFLLGLAGWEAVQVNSGGRKAFAGAILPPPLRSRSGERPQAVREIQAGDPIANYLARAKRGMTEQEVRWMLEDFEAAGLDRVEDELVDLSAAKAHRQKLEEWYLSALSEGLSLTPEQKEEVKVRLDARFANDLQNVEELKNSSVGWKKQHPDQSLCGADLSEAYQRFCRFRARLFFDSSFAPWNVVQLSEQQTAVTVRYWLIEDWKRQSAEDPFWDPDKVEPEYWLYDKAHDPFAEPIQQTIIQDPIAGNLLENSGPMTCRQHILQSAVFAFTPEQVPSWNEAASLLAQAKCCHPAQLRMALLEDPNLFQSMRTELDGAADVQKSHSALSQ